MPGPGSNQYDRDRKELRGELTDQGLSDDEAAAEAKRRLEEPLEEARDPDVLPDRARGPVSERLPEER